MTDDGRSFLPAPGWYLDPESGARRWWNGIAWANRADERHALEAAHGRPDPPAGPADEHRA